MNSKLEFNKKLLKKYLDDNDMSNQYLELSKRLEDGEALQYVVGNVDFYGNTIFINKDVLIPRFCTEELVSYMTKYINKYFNDKNISILDIGTGSGCISIALKKTNEDFKIDACDISENALNMAKNNALYNDVSINFILSDIFSNINNKYDVIISNPPYIGKNEEIEELVYNNEPHLALFASDDGLYFYDKILSNIHYYLKDKYIIGFEIGYLQADMIKDMIIKYLGNVNIDILNDMEGKNRFIFINNFE